MLASTLTTQYINLYASAKLEASKMQKLRDFYTQIQVIKAAAMPEATPSAPPSPTAGAAPTAVPEAPPSSPILPNSPS
jgi:hypothetical protein